jgi:hypothetical protein
MAKKRALDGAADVLVLFTDRVAVKMGANFEARDLSGARRGAVIKNFTTKETRTNEILGPLTRFSACIMSTVAIRASSTRRWCAA